MLGGPVRDFADQHFSPSHVCRRFELTQQTGSRVKTVKNPAGSAMQCESRTRCRIARFPNRIHVHNARGSTVCACSLELSMIKTAYTFRGNGSVKRVEPSPQLRGCLVFNEKRALRICARTLLLPHKPQSSGMHTS